MFETTGSTVVLAGTVLNGLGETELTELRRAHVGFVFQATTRCRR